MKRNSFKGVLAGAIAITVLGLAGPTFAHDGYKGGGMGYGSGNGRHMMDEGYRGGSRGYGRETDLTDEKIDQLEKIREDYFNSTRSLKEDIHNKRQEMRSELSKTNPDANKLSKIQKDLSKLESKFDQKQIDHELAVRKIAPDSSRGYADRGTGRGGNCWR